MSPSVIIPTILLFLFTTVAPSLFLVISEITILTGELVSTDGRSCFFASSPAVKYNFFPNAPPG